ncbi:hypothetical protein MNV49_005550 [Pseudohyphozyma bogoriensis]|nr:hypothetical protein MNV49_005550 [Pseudohyphozyma bogoriensis]
MMEPSASEASFSTSANTSLLSTNPHHLDPTHAEFDLDAEPSFSSANFQTSTPLRPRRAFRQSSESDEEGEGEQQPDGLRASDTESVPEDDLDISLGGGTSGSKTATRLRLTRRSLAQISSASASAGPSADASGALRGSRDASGGAHGLLGGLAGWPMAPSPSTGSSTLVEKDEYRYSGSEGGKGKGKARERDDVTLRPASARKGRGIAEETVYEAQEVEEDVDFSSRSPPRTRRKRRGTAELASYIDARVTATPPPASSRQHPASHRTPLQSGTTANISTPAAPGAFPASIRKPRVSPPSLYPASSPPANATSPSTTSGATQMSRDNAALEQRVREQQESDYDQHRYDPETGSSMEEEEDVSEEDQAEYRAQNSRVRFAMGDVEDDEEAGKTDPVRDIAVELLDAVRTLSKSESKLDSRGLPLPEDGLVASLTRRKKDSENRRRELEARLQGLQREGAVDANKREDMLRKLDVAQVEEGTLLARMDDLRKSVEELGNKLGAKVSEVVHDALEAESRKRGHWFAWALALQLVILWVMIRFANSRANHNLASLQYDPFYPALFLPSSSANLPPISPETLAIFSPRHATASFDLGLGTVKAFAGAARRGVDEFRLGRNPDYDNPSKLNAQVNTTVGGVRETVGEQMGWQDTQKAGMEQKAMGDAEYKDAQARGYVQGTKDRVEGKIDNVIGAVTGDSEQQLSGKARTEKGATQQQVRPRLR